MKTEMFSLRQFPQRDQLAMLLVNTQLLMFSYFAICYNYGPWALTVLHSASTHIVTSIANYKAKHLNVSHNQIANCTIFNF